MFSFISPIDNVTPVTVAFNNDMASFMEYNFGNDGPGQGEANEIAAASIPLETTDWETFVLESASEDAGTFTAHVYGLPSSPNSLILSVMALGTMEAEEPRVVSISLSLPYVEGTPHAATADPGGIGLTRDEWVSIYGEASDAVGELELYPGLGPDGMDLEVTHTTVPEQITVQSIQANSAADAPIATSFENAVTFVGGSVPEDSVVGMYYTLPATDAGPIALDAVLWTSLALREQLDYEGSVLSMMYLTSGDAGETVQRIDLALNTSIDSQ